MKCIFRLTLVVFVLPSLVFAERFYVDVIAEEEGDGQSWDTAFRYLQDALDETVAGRGDEVWIGEGMYYPDQGAAVTEGDRTESFHVKEHVTLYGGFAGGETELDERDWESNRTILSGEIDENKGSWSYHVLHVSNGVLDGVEVVRGNANGEDERSRSGAVVVKGSITAINATFSENSAKEGGVSYGGEWEVINSVFRENSAKRRSGGVASGSDWTVTDSVFKENSAEIHGGVVRGGTWEVANSVFESNSAKNGMGGVAALFSDWEVVNSVFEGNSAAENGGVAAGVRWKVVNSTFLGNSAEGNGNVGNQGHWRVWNNIFADEASFYDLDSFSNAEPGDSSDPERAANLIADGVASLPDDADTGSPELVIDADPLFVDPENPAGPDGIWGTEDDGLRLHEDSPAIAQGNAFFLPDDVHDLDKDKVTDKTIPIDFAGFARIQGEGLDLGAYEYGDEKPGSK